MTKPKGIMARKKWKAKEEARVVTSPRRIDQTKKNKISQIETPSNPGITIFRVK